MKLSDYVAQFLASQGIRHVFAISGGASVHLIQSVFDTPGIDFVCPQHEQAGAMAADAYSRVTGNLGAAISTSGPGATNMLTGVCCAYYDSVPVLFITGQVTTFRLKRQTGVRQLGFQETDTTDVYRPVTKYAVQITDPGKIRFELEKASYLAKSGRPGPVLIDIPDDLQRVDVEPGRLEAFVPPEGNSADDVSDEKIRQCIELLNEARRPVIILGWGVRLAGAAELATKLVAATGFPVALTWGAADLFPFDHPQLIGTFGTHGTRYGNFAVQNADLVLAIGARLDTREAGSPPTSFARGARKIVVDIDQDELNKFKMLGMDVDLTICGDAKVLLNAILRAQGGILPRDVSEWMLRIRTWKAQYPVCSDANCHELSVNPYAFVRTLSRQLQDGDTVVVDTGCTLAWTMQGFEFKKAQRLLHDFNNTAMGYALPAAIGASLALERRRVICVTGDGSLQMNIQELATVMRHRLPIKIFLVNNHGYSMIQQTQDQWLGSCYLASTVEGGLAFPDFARVADAYGYKTIHIRENAQLGIRLREALDFDGPTFCNVEIDSRHRVIPQVRFGRPIEDSEPFLERAEFIENMIVRPEESSLVF